MKWLYDDEFTWDIIICDQNPRFSRFWRKRDQRTDRRTDGPTDGRTDGPTDGRTDRPSYRDARTHLKMIPNLGSQLSSALAICIVVCQAHFLVDLSILALTHVAFLQRDGRLYSYWRRREEAFGLISIDSDQLLSIGCMPFLVTTKQLSMTVCLLVCNPWA